jgi:hypothetical protein
MLRHFESQISCFFFSDFGLLLLLLLQLNPSGPVGQTLVQQRLKHRTELGHDLEKEKQINNKIELSYFGLKMIGFIKIPKILRKMR